MKTLPRITYRTQKIGNAPVVVLPLRDWELIQDQIEDAEMYASVAFTKKIATARRSKHFHSVADAKKLLGIG